MAKRYVAEECRRHLARQGRAEELLCCWGLDRAQSSGGRDPRRRERRGRRSRIWWKVGPKKVSRLLLAPTSLWYMDLAGNGRYRGNGRCQRTTIDH